MILMSLQAKQRNLWKQKWYRVALISTGALSVVLFSITAYAASKTMPDMPAEVSSEEEPAAPQTVHPEMISGSSSTILIGTVLSNETANIFPRREGIVEDIYVDIGDTVAKNQVVARLLLKGVEGQSAAMIGEKQARTAQAEVDHATAAQVADSTVDSAQQKIREKETELAVAQQKQQALIEQFVQSETNRNQMLEQVFITIRQARQTVEEILVGSLSRGDQNIREDDMHRLLGQIAPETRYQVIPSFIALQEAENEFMSEPEIAMQRLPSLVNDALMKTNDLLAATPTVPNVKPGMFTQQQLTDMSARVRNVQYEMLKAKERWEDARLAHETLIAGELEFYNAWKSGNLQGAKSNAVRMTEEQLASVQRGFELTQAQQDQMVQRAGTMVGVAKAMLYVEVAQSGNREIRSPFSGTVSKRFIEVGKIVMPSGAAFELTGVPTSLAKKAKSEIQFGLPERLQGALEIGDHVTFFLPGNGTKEYDAIVTRKSPQVDRETHTVTVQAKIDDGLNLPHQTSVRIRIVDTSAPLFRVPSFAVKRENERNYIWIMNPESQEPEQLYVNVRAEDGESAEVTGDLSEETVVLLDPPELIMLMVSGKETDDSPQAQ